MWADKRQVFLVPVDAVVAAKLVTCFAECTNLSEPLCFVQGNRRRVGYGNSSKRPVQLKRDQMFKQVAIQTLAKPFTEMVGIQVDGSFY